MLSRTCTSLLPLLIGILVVVAVGCDDLTRPQSRVEVRLSQSASAHLSQSIAIGALLNISGTDIAAGRVPMSAVASIDVNVIRVDALPAHESEGEAGRWISLDLAGDARRINLLALPTEGGITVAAGALPDGEYGNLRLLIGEASITVSEPITLGNGPNPRTLAAGVHELRIPSAAQTGLKLPGRFTVSRAGEGETTIISVTFDSSASVQSLQWTGKGVQMSPVLTSRTK